MHRLFPLFFLVGLALLFSGSVSAQVVNTSTDPSEVNVSNNSNVSENANTVVTNSSALTNSEKTESEQEADDIINNPGLLPDSPIFFLKTWYEKAQLAFTFDNAKKAVMEHRFALRRVVEAEKLVEKGNVELAQQHLEKYQGLLDGLQERVAGAENAGKDVNALLGKLELFQERQQVVLQHVYEQVPAPAHDSIQHVMELSAQGLENAVQEVKGSEKAKEFRDRLTAKIDEEGIFLGGENGNTNTGTDSDTLPVRSSNVLNKKTITLAVGESESVFGLTVTLQEIGNEMATIVPVMGNVRGNSNPAMMPEEGLTPQSFGSPVVLPLNTEVVMDQLFNYFQLTALTDTSATIDVYFKANTKAHLVLHRTMRDCTTREPILDEYGRDEQMFTVGEGSDYYNYTCKNRYEEQCAEDGTADRYYDESCERILVPEQS